MDVLWEERGGRDRGQEDSGTDRRRNEGDR